MTPEANSHDGAIQVNLDAAVHSIERCLSIQREPQPVRDAIEMIRWLAANDPRRFERLSEEAASEVQSSDTHAPKPPCVLSASSRPPE